MSSRKLPELKTNLKNQLINTPGFSADLCLKADELLSLQDIIDGHFRDRIKEFMDCPDDMKSRDYHLLGVKNHSEVWKKDGRFISPYGVDVIKGFSIFDQIRDELGEFEISRRVDQDGKVYNSEEMYWRIVRPNEPSDVGPIHADIWFADTLEYFDTIIAGRDSLKIWIPVYCQAGRNGLSLVPDSHNRSFAYENFDLNGALRPKIIESVNPILIETEPGQAVIFGDKLLHGGSLNNGNTTRVSMEVTLLFEAGTLYRTQPKSH